jgi:hypothetical protein
VAIRGVFDSANDSALTVADGLPVCGVVDATNDLAVWIANRNAIDRPLTTDGRYSTRKAKRSQATFSYSYGRITRRMSQSIPTAKWLNHCVAECFS